MSLLVRIIYNPWWASLWLSVAFFFTMALLNDSAIPPRLDFWLRLSASLVVMLVTRLLLWWCNRE